MSAMSTHPLASGGTLTIVRCVPLEAPITYRVDERNELGTFVRFAYSDTDLARVEAWVARQTRDADDVAVDELVELLRRSLVAASPYPSHRREAARRLAEAFGFETREAVSDLTALADLLGVEVSS